MRIQFINHGHTFDELRIGDVFMLEGQPDPKLIFLCLEEFTTADDDTYNAVNLTTMEYTVFGDDEKIIPYEATLTLK